MSSNHRQGCQNLWYNRGGEHRLTSHAVRQGTRILTTRHTNITTGPWLAPSSSSWALAHSPTGKWQADASNRKKVCWKTTSRLICLYARLLNIFSLAPWNHVELIDSHQETNENNGNQKALRIDSSKNQVSVWMPGCLRHNDHAENGARLQASWCTPPRQFPWKNSPAIPHT